MIWVMEILKIYIEEQMLIKYKYMTSVSKNVYIDK